jgi:heat shock protein HslJ
MRMVAIPATFKSMNIAFLFSLMCASALLMGCGSPTKLFAAEPSTPLTGTEWTLVELDGKPVAITDGMRTPTLQLDSTNKRVSGTSGINRYFGGYESKGAALKFGPFAGTKIGGPPAAMAVERAFLKALASVSSWNITSNRLALKAGDETVLHFQAK